MRPDKSCIYIFVLEVISQAGEPPASRSSLASKLSLKEIYISLEGKGVMGRRWIGVGEKEKEGAERRVVGDIGEGREGGRKERGVGGESGVREG